MSEDDRLPDGTPRSASDQTLLGVAPPPLESTADSPLRSPVFVRAGTSVADAEPPQVPRMALPSRPPLTAAADSDAAMQLRVGPNGARAAASRFERARGYLLRHPALWMLLAPALISLFAIALLRALSPQHPRELVPSAPGESSAAQHHGSAVPEATTAEALAKLEGRPAESLNARELALLADAHSEGLRASAKALRSKVEANPALGNNPALQSELLRLADDPRSSVDALAALAALEKPSAADLLYEVWTRTSVRSDATDLARALLYSSDVRPKASPALAVALELRAAESCEQYKAILPKALRDGDRRASQLLAKLNGKRGCGPKKSEDCYACLREQGDELKATISAVKSRRPPEYSVP